MKWLPRTVISCWLGQRRQNSRWGAGEDDARIGVDEELGKIAPGEPLGIGVGDGHDVRRLAVDRDLPGPGQSRAPRLAGFEEGATVDRHLGFGQAA
jgi:hypothetical protein